MRVSVRECMEGSMCERVSDLGSDCIHGWMNKEANKKLSERISMGVSE